MAKTTIAELKIQVKNYIDHMVGKTQADPQEIFLAATISLETLNQITSNYSDCTGIRIYLTKEKTDGSGDIWPLIVPVRKDGDDHFTDLMADDNPIMESGIMGAFDCRNPPCAVRNRGTKLLP